MELRKVGRPLKIETPEQMEKILNEYFSTTEENKITITGICLALDLDKSNFYEYEKREGYRDIVKRARMIVENSYEISLRENGRTGDIFALKNFGWTDKQEVENTTHNKVTIVNSLPKDDEDESND
jgi:hypothetical protein